MGQPVHLSPNKQHFSMEIVDEGLSMGVLEGLRSEMKHFEEPRGMRVYSKKEPRIRFHCASKFKPKH